MKLFKKLNNFFNKHPEEVCMNYINHLKFSGNICLKLMIGSFKAFVHAIFPEIFKTSTTDLIDEIGVDLITSGCRNKRKIRNRVRACSF